MKARLPTIIKSGWFIGGAAFILGAATIIAIRFVTYHPEGVHYHANFAVYLNGQKEQFKDMEYYEETAATSCTLEKVETPLVRAHMHGNVNDVVHVEDHLVTWGTFFQNLGWGIGNDYLKTANKIYTPDAQNKLTFMLNGKKVDSVTNLIIKDEDKLLVSYGNELNDKLQKEYGSIPSTAYKYDIERDPASCSGHKSTTTSDRFKHLF